MFKINYSLIPGKDSELTKFAYTLPIHKINISTSVTFANISFESTLLTYFLGDTPVLNIGLVQFQRKQSQFF